MRITIIGGGNMGTAIARGLINHPERPELIISDPQPEKLKEFQEQGVSVISNNLEAIQNSQFTIIAIKPQQLESLFEELKDNIPANALIISICAGVSINRFQSGLNHQKIVRAMPNTPAKIASGITGWYASEEVTPEQKKSIKNILTSVGMEVEVNSEDLIDAVTAISGSGPAYFFYFLENIIKAGEDLGLTPEQSKTLALQTAQGAAQLAFQDQDDLQTLRQKVTSKGGTTEAAINSMQSNQVGEKIIEAVNQAYKRAKEL